MGCSSSSNNSRGSGIRGSSVELVVVESMEIRRSSSKEGDG